MFDVQFNDETTQLDLKEGYILLGDKVVKVCRGLRIFHEPANFLHTRVKVSLEGSGSLEKGKYNRTSFTCSKSDFKSLIKSIEFVSASKDSYWEGSEIRPSDFYVGKVLL